MLFFEPENRAIFKDLRLRGQGQGLQNVSSRSRTFSRTPLLLDAPFCWAFSNARWLLLFTFMNTSSYLVFNFFSLLSFVFGFLLFRILFVFEFRISKLVYPIVNTHIICRLTLGGSKVVLIIKLDR